MNFVSIVVVAVIAVFTSITAPALIAWQTQRIRHQERREDWARQDAVAAEAKAAAAAQADRDARTARLLRETNAQVAVTAEETNGKLDTIHGLVNSSLSAAIQAELDATVRELAMMREVIALNHAAGREPSMQARAAVEATEAKITELTATLTERNEAARRVAEQQQRRKREDRGQDPAQ